MYRSIIEIKKSVSEETLENLRRMAENAFHNRAGNVTNSSNDSHLFIFEGGEKDYGCLDLGVLSLGKSKTFLDNTHSWHWIEDDPGECCDMLKLLAVR